MAFSMLPSSIKGMLIKISSFLKIADISVWSVFFLMLVIFSVALVLCDIVKMVLIL